LRNARVLIVAALLAFLVIAAYLVSRNVGGGGQARTFDLKVTGTTMTPAKITAKQGDTITINVSADKQEEIHLHGYDIAFEVPSAGGTVSHTFKADKTGDFEIEIEDSSTQVGELDVSP